MIDYPSGSFSFALSIGSSTQGDDAVFQQVSELQAEVSLA